jgi:hypothetical protein
LRRNRRGKVTAVRSAEEGTAKPPDEGETKGREVETAQRVYLDATYNRETTARAPRWKNSGEAGIIHAAPQDARPGSLRGVQIRAKRFATSPPLLAPSSTRPAPAPATVRIVNLLYGEPGQPEYRKIPLNHS